MDTTDWQEFALPGFRLHFRYPIVTPQGRTVERTEQQHDDARGVHLTTHDKAELYFEVVQFSDLAPRDEYARHRTNLEERFGAGSTGALTETSLKGRPARAYDFRWGERSAILLQVGRDTYRIIYDPRFPLNRQVIETVDLTE